MANEVNTENDMADVDICRVCRCEGTSDRPLFYPCLCHGSIRFVHDDCLIQWLKISRKDECELCGTKFRFTPIYHPSMPPGRLPLKDLINGLLRTFFKALRYWLHYLIVAFCWLGVVPITASRIYRCLFAGSISSILTLPYDIVSTDHLLTDVLQGGLVVFCSLGAFICLLWLREQILTGGGPAWLQPAEPELVRQPAAAAAAPPPQVNVIPLVAPVDAVPLAPLPPPPPPVAINDEQPPAPLQNEPEHEEGAFVDAVDDEDEDDDDEDGEEEQANIAIPPVVIAGNVQNQEHNHNWIDWDRAADDLTWERLLGLDGSLQFLEHVFWVVTLNTLFILIFAYAPYHLGKIIISTKTFRRTIADTRFTNPINTLTTYGCVSALIGYIFISFILLITFTILSFVNYLTRIRRLVGLAYIVLKVALLVILEILLFPFICGIWLDVCSLRILNERTVTLNDRLLQFQMSPGTSTFLHWLCGMVFVFYFATFIFLLREVLRPGALWFLKSINDMDFNPIQEMIQLPLALHLRRFATSIIIFGCVIILMFYIPGELLIRSIPKFLPFNVKGSLETVVSELMIEFILLQGILPTLLEQGHTRTMLKYLLQLWVELASWILGLRSFLLGDSPPPTIINTPRVDQNDNVLPMPLAVIPDQAQNNQVEQVLPPPPPPPPPPAPPVQTTSSTSQPFLEPSFFRLRLIGLCLFTCLSLTFLSILGLTIPATIGRYLLGFITGSARLHELYTILSGLYILWLITRIIFFIRSLLPFDIKNILTRLKSYTILCVRVILCTFCVIGYVPFMIGLASELVLIIPLSTSIEQTAVLTPLRVWIIGLLNTKIAIALIMSGPQWRLKTVLERLYQDGLRRIDFSYLINEFLLPFTLNIGMFMAFPYLAVAYICPILFNSTAVHQIERYIYSAIISLMLLLAFIIFQIKQLRLLFEHVRDEKYLVGRRLINFER